MAEVKKQRAPRKAKTAEPKDGGDAAAVVEPVADAANTEQKERKPRAPRAPKEAPFDFVGAAIGKYAEGGWNVYRCDGKNINDFIAHREKKLHYVRVVPSNSSEDLKYHGESKTSFTQNALSNSAIPVFASVRPVMKKGETSPSGSMVSLSNVNTGTQVLVGKAAPKTV